MSKQMIFVPTTKLSKKTVRLALHALESRRKKVAFDARAWEKYRSGSQAAVKKNAEIVAAISELKTYLRDL